MLRHRIHRVVSIAGCWACLLVPAAAAQSVALQGGEIRIVDNDGVEAWRGTKAGDLFMGGHGRCGDLNLKQQDDSTTMLFSACTGDLTLGGGNDDGDVRLTDTDGVTTTVSLDGGTGLLELGSPDDDGDLWLWDNSPDSQQSIVLNGASGNATQQLGGNGFVKAWARINADGSVHSCFLCLPLATSRLNQGVYRVDFSLLSSDIRSRPRLAVVDRHAAATPDGFASLADDGSMTSAVHVITSGFQCNLDQNDCYFATLDRSFTVFIF